MGVDRYWEYQDELRQCPARLAAAQSRIAEQDRELAEHRAMMRRLEEWAVQLEDANHPVRSTVDVAAELRNRMKGTP